MCERLPGDRCAADSAYKCNECLALYRSMYEDGPEPDGAWRAEFVKIVSSTEPIPENTYRILPWRMLELREKIDNANKRLERAGISERFTYTTQPVLVETTVTRDGEERIEREYFAEVTISAPAISYGGWTFVASVDSTEAGIVTRVAPGQSLDGWRPESIHCDHCNQKRHRSNTYIVRDTEGNIRQVGSGCLRPFLGVTPGALWALEFEPDDSKRKDTDRDVVHREWERGGPRDVREIIGFALAVSQGGAGYVSRAKAELTEQTPTATRVEQVLEQPRGAKAAERWRLIRDRAYQYIADGTVDEVIKMAKNLPGNSDYAANMRVIMSNDVIDARHIGMAVSAVGAWHREKQRELERAGIAKGFMAPVGEKIAGTKATVTRVKYIDNPYQRHGVNTLVLFRSEDGHVIKWFASGRKDFKVGQTGTFTGGTVKEHSTYKDTDQTVVTRVKFQTE